MISDRYRHRRQDASPRCPILHDATPILHDDWGGGRTPPPCRPASTPPSSGALIPRAPDASFPIFIVDGAKALSTVLRRSPDRIAPRGRMSPSSAARSPLFPSMGPAPSPVGCPKGHGPGDHRRVRQALSFRIGGCRGDGGCGCGRGGPAHPHPQFRAP